jgi:tetratricopeptide (TPR) repeat protein
MDHDEIVGKLSELEVKVRDIKHEIHKPKTASEKIRDYAGLVSLALGILISLFTVYEYLVMKPAALRVERSVLLHSTIDSIVSLDQEYARLPPQGDAPLLSALTRKLIQLTDVAAGLLNDGQEIASGEDLLILGDACAQTGQFEKAATYFEAASKKSGIEPGDRAIAEAKHAHLICTSTQHPDFAAIEKQFNFAITLLSNSNSTPSQMSSANIYLLRASCECSRGSLKEGLASKERAFAIADAAGQSPDGSAIIGQITGFKTYAEGMLSTTPCGTLPVVKSP